MPKDEDSKSAMRHSQADHSIELPKKDKSKKVWIIISIVLVLALVGIGIYGYIKMKDYNKQINDLKAQVVTLQDGKKALESKTHTWQTRISAAIGGNKTQCE